MCCVSDVACFCWVLIFVMVGFDCALRYFGGFGLWFWFCVVWWFGVLAGLVALIACGFNVY